RLQETEPLALFRRMKTVEPDRILGHLRLDHQRDMRAGREFRQRRAWTLHEIPDAADIDDGVVFRDAVDDAGEFAADASAASMRARVPARCACAMAQASASAASPCSTEHVGKRRRTIAWTCSFCA